MIDKKLRSRMICGMHLPSAHPWSVSSQSHNDWHPPFFFINTRILLNIIIDFDDFDDEIDDKDDDDKIFDEIMRDMQTDIEDGDLKSGQVHAYTTDNNDDIFDYEI